MTGLKNFTMDEMQAFARSFEQLFYDDRGAEMAAFYTDNARLMGDGIAPIQGRSEIARFWEMTCERARQLNMKRSIAIEEIQSTETLSYAVSTLTVTVQTADNTTITNTVKDITIWRKQSDGSWQIEVDISNQNPASVNN